MVKKKHRASNSVVECGGELVEMSYHSLTRAFADGQGDKPRKKNDTRSSMSVAVRMRPLNQREKAGGSTVNISNKRLISLSGISIPGFHTG